MDNSISYFSRVSSILEAMPDALVIADESGKIVLINQQTENLFGYERTELLGEAVEKLMPVRFRKKHPEHRKNYTSHPKVRPMGSGLELFGLKKNGIEFPIEISLSPLETEDGLFALAAVRDVTDRKSLYEKICAKNLELENASLAKDRFLASMSHELRTPLNAIIGFTGTLLMKLPGPLNPPQEKQLNTIKSSAKHLLSLINNLLDIAKIEAGKVELKIEEFSCQSIIKEMMGMLQPLADSKGLKLEVQTPNDEVMVNTDRRVLMQIIINLANNAIKFTEHGKITIQVEKQQVDEKDIIAINVIDTGVGISPEDQNKLFQAFQQTSVAGRRVEGTGLGLHLSQKLAGLVNGKIDFESERGNGSRFSVYLPLN